MGKIKVGDGSESAPDSIHWCSPLWMTDGARRVFQAGGHAGTDLDPCPNPGSIPRIGAKCNLLLSRGHDGLKTSWQNPEPGVTNGNAWVNPPFGRYYFNPTTQDFLSPKDVKQGVERLCRETPGMTKEEAKQVVLAGFEAHSIREWIDLCRANAAAGMDILQVGPASVGSGWWQEIIEKSASAILYIRGRVRYELVDFTTMQVVSVGNSAPMDCAISLWTKNPLVLKGFQSEFSSRGCIHLLANGRNRAAAAAIGAAP